MGRDGSMSVFPETTGAAVVMGIVVVVINVVVVVVAADVVVVVVVVVGAEVNTAMSVSAGAAAITAVSVCLEMACFGVSILEHAPPSTKTAAMTHALMIRCRFFMTFSLLLVLVSNSVMRISPFSGKTLFNVTTGG